MTAQPGPAEDPTAPSASQAAPTPRSAAEALDRASAAYEFGDLDLMVDLSRQVAEGALAGNTDQRAEALRLLGIGLYLSGRQDGAERVFIDLVQLRPHTNLDASITRPEVVAFFRDVKRRNQPRKQVILAFLPPLGQFQNDTPTRGWIFGALEAVTFGAALTTRLVLASWVDANERCHGGNDPAPCNRVKLLNLVSVAALAATWGTGVLDALMVMRDDTERTPESRDSRASLTILPNGASLRVPF